MSYNYLSKILDTLQDSSSSSEDKEENTKQNEEGSSLALSSLSPFSLLTEIISFFVRPCYTVLTSSQNESYVDPASTIEQTLRKQDDTILERSKYIPVRLSLRERKLLRLLESSLSISEYTNRIDSDRFSKNKNGPQNKQPLRRLDSQVREFCSMMCGLVAATDYEIGQKLISEHNFSEYKSWFRSIFEIGRRHKVMNPEKMRSEYGNLIYMLQDAVSVDVQQILEFNPKKDMLTVYKLLNSHQSIHLLEDPLVPTAVQEIIDNGKKPRWMIQRQIKEKEAAVEHLAHKYSNSTLEAETVRLCLRSIGDNNAFLRGNCESLDRMINLLQHYFDPTNYQPSWSLAIVAGKDGARLSHDHERQYNYVIQSLTLWKEIQLDMYRLWYLAEQDLLNEENPYRLTDTGQGLHRVQQAPQTMEAMYKILWDTKDRLKNWVGSSLIHLGDSNVPNSLMFIDKYTQVPRIINPIIITIKEIDRIYKDPGLRIYIDKTFSGPEPLKKLILHDFFRHGFDGSGADNFFEAGSCIDGRLTSAWNWCSQLSTKVYYPIFKLTGFLGFDGEFQK